MKYGALKNKIDYRDIPVSAFQPSTEIPQYYATDITKLPVMNQLGLGSCFTAETLIQMSNGDMKPIKDVIVGDEVIDAFGEKQIVTRLFHRKWQGNIYRIYPFGMNIPIDCTPEHPFLLENGEFKEAKDLTTKDKLVIPINREVKDKTDFYYEKDQDFLRVFGLYLAEGSVGYCRLVFSMAEHEEDIINFIDKTIYRIFGKKGSLYKNGKKLEIRFNDFRIAKIFEDLGGNGSINKKIHSKFLLLEPRLQYEIFYGWLLGDGSFKNKKSIVAVTISKTLALQMFLICLRNKIIPNLRIRKAYGVHKEAYNIEINSTDCNKINKNIYKKEKSRKSDNWRGIFKNDVLFRRIRLIEKRISKSSKNFIQNWKASTSVYNIETTGSHTYTANYIGVHNCVGHAIGLYLQYLDYKETGKITKISPRQVYAMSKALDGYTAEGTYPRTAISQVLKNGVTTEDVVPCDDTLKHADYIKVDFGGDYKIKGYAFVNPTALQIKQALINNGLVLASLEVGDFSKATVKPGNNGLHYITIFGYNGDTFLFRNSWGEKWGDNGNGYFNFNDFEGKIHDTMVITDVPNTLKPKNTAYRRGDRSEGVSKLQRDLKSLGYFTYPFITGYFGPVTEASVKDFQRANKLVVDGIAGSKTLTKIEELKKKPKLGLIDALIKVESDGNDYAIGDLKLKNKAYGCLQIRQPACDDVNRWFGTIYRAEDMLGNRTKSIDVFNKYMSIYCKDFSDEFKARVWNGGPEGYLRSATIPYWTKVKKAMGVEN